MQAKWSRQWRIWGWMIALVLGMWIQPARAETSVPPFIMQDTTWALEDSPYIVGQTTIQAGIALTIEAGVEVRFLTGGWLSTSSTGPSTLIAQGTENAPVVFTSAADTPQPGDWTYLYNHPGGTFQLGHCVVEYAGRGNSPAIVLQQGNIHLADCTVRDSSGPGIQLVTPGMTPLLERVLVERTTRAIQQDSIDMQPRYRDLRLRDNTENAVHITANNTTRDLVLDTTGILEGILSLGTHYVGTGTTLTVTPGSTLAFRTGGWLSTSNTGPSTLIAQGTEDAPVVFTSAAENPQPGDWNYLYNHPGGTFQLGHCVVEYAGRGSSPAIVLQQGNIHLADCTVRDSSGPGIQLVTPGMTARLERVLVERTTRAIQQDSIDMQPIYRDLRLRDNTENAVHITANNTTRDLVLDTTGILEGILSLGTHYVGTGTTLTVTPGSTLAFRTGGWLSTSNTGPSTLIAQGTPDNPITFTSAAENPQPGDWIYLYNHPNGTLQIRHCVVEYAADGLYTQVRLLIDSCTFRHNTTGLNVINNAGGTVINSRFENNGTAINNLSPAQPVRAFGNWWNHPTGPTHSANPAGQGDPVSNGVLYQGWLVRIDASGRSATELQLDQTLQRTLNPANLDDFVFRAVGGENLLLEIRPAAGTLPASLAVLARTGALPWADLGENDAATVTMVEGVYFLNRPNVAPGNHYFTVLAELAIANVPYSITLSDTENRVAVVAPRIAGPVPTSFAGYGMFNTNTAQVHLCNATDSNLRAATLNIIDNRTANILLDLEGIALGIYDLCIIWPDASTQRMNNAIDIQPPTPRVEAWLESPAAMRPGRRYTVYVHYASTGNVPAPAPAFVLDAENARLSIHPDGATSTRVRLFGFNDQPPFGVLPPGTTRRIPVYLDVTSTSTVNLKLKTITEGSDDPFDWATLENQLRPPTVPPDWNSRWAATIAPFGNTWGSFIAQINTYANLTPAMSEPASPDTTLLLWLYNALSGATPPAAASVAAIDHPAAALTLVCGNTATENKYTYLYDPAADVDLQGFDASSFNEDLPTNIFIHGLHEGASAMYGIEEVGEGPANFIRVDWERGATISTGMVFLITQCRAPNGATGPQLAGQVAAILLRNALSGAGKTLNLDTTTFFVRDVGMDLALAMVRGWPGKPGTVWFNPPASPNGYLINTAKGVFDPKRSLFILTPSSPNDALPAELEGFGWNERIVYPPTSDKPRNLLELEIARQQAYTMYLTLGKNAPWEDPISKVSEPKPVPFPLPYPETEVTPPPDDGSVVIWEEIVPVITSWDPNAKEAWSAYAMPGDTIRWTIYFENLASAGAPAQEVFISDLLPPELDPVSVRLQEVGFSGNSLSLRSIYNTQTGSVRASTIVPDYRAEVTAPIEVRVEASANLQTGALSWIFTTLDPATGTFPEDALAGFLPPNDATGRGEGYVIFEVRIRPNVPLGTVISNEAGIIFDTNEAINTGAATLIVGTPPGDEQPIYLPSLRR